MNDSYVQRMTEIRQRFATQLESKIEQIECATLRDGSGASFDAVALAHRQAHGLCGVGPTLGFVGTGRVARSIEQFLLAVVKSGRELTDDEIPWLRDGVALLRITARAEIDAVH